MGRNHVRCPVTLGDARGILLGVMMATRSTPEADLCWGSAGSDQGASQSNNDSHMLNRICHCDCWLRRQIMPRLAGDVHYSIIEALFWDNYKFDKIGEALVSRI